MLLLEERQVIQHIHRGDMRIIEAAICALAVRNIERILGIRQCAATSEAVEDLARSINGVAEGVAHTRRHAVPGLNIEPRLDTLVVRHAHVVAREDARLAAVCIPGSKSWSSCRGTRSKAGRNQTSVACGNERAKCWVFIHVLEQADAMIPHVANLADDA